MKENHLLEVAAVSKTFTQNKAQLEVLHKVSFTLDRGEFISLVGPSGCGKTTVLRIVADLEKADSGAVHFTGEGGEPKKQVNTGFIFQAYNTFPWLTVRENVAFGLPEKKTAQAKEKVARWLSDTGLAKFADYYPKKLSGGMQQRLAIARTMVTEPELLLMDEPFGALDIKTREAMQQLLLSVVRRTNCAVLFVTHDIQEAVYLSDKILLMEASPGTVRKIFKSGGSKKGFRDLLKDEENLSVYNQIIASI